MKLKIPGLNEEQMFILLNASKFDQYCETVKQMLRGECPFCNTKWLNGDIVYRNKCWFVWRNPWPQAHQEHHIVIANTRHVFHICDLTDEDWVTYGDMVRWVCRRYDVEGGVEATRFGKPELSLTSQKHYHSNIRVPDGKGPVAVVVARSKEETGRKVRIICIFEKMRQGKPFKDLSPKEQALVEKIIN